MDFMERAKLRNVNCEIIDVKQKIEEQNKLIKRAPLLGKIKIKLMIGKLNNKIRKLEERL